jgi:hypothetical protein
MDPGEDRHCMTTRVFHEFCRNFPDGKSGVINQSLTSWAYSYGLWPRNRRFSNVNQRDARVARRSTRTSKRANARQSDQILATVYPTPICRVSDLGGNNRSSAHAAHPRAAVRERSDDCPRQRMKGACGLQHTGHSSAYLNERELTHRSRTVALAVEGELRSRRHS